MEWNWQQIGWPDFSYDAASLRQKEDEFLHAAGVMFGAFSHLGENDVQQIRVELLSDEALETSLIEGEILNRDSLQSSVRRHFGLAIDDRQSSPAEQGVSELMVDAYTHYNMPLTRQRLCRWHGMIMQGRTDLNEVGSFRTMGDPMRIVSGPIHDPQVHFEAPPAKRVAQEMNRFIGWFNDESKLYPSLTRAAIAHLYFESIHPFEDGNGRIGRAIAEVSLSQSLGKPVLLALSKIISQTRKEYYRQLADGSRSLNISEWMHYFASAVLEAQEHARKQVEFLIAKGKFFDRFGDRLNQRQEKVILRVFREGPDGFRGGLSAGNYGRIAKTSTATVTRDLNELLAMGAVAKTGDKRYARYHLNWEGF